MPTYSDSPEGARRLLAAETDLSGVEIERARFRPDPSIRGVYLATLDDGRRFLLYLSNFLDELVAGNVEEVEPEEVGNVD